MNAHRGSLSHYYAHSVPGSPDCTNWEPLSVHLQRVAELAARFAAAFHAEDWGRCAGLLHDLGKYSEKFQGYLLTVNGFEAHLEQYSRVDHSTAGAQRAVELAPEAGRLLAYVIAGHHAGLANASGSRSSLEDRLKCTVDPIAHASREALLSELPLGKPNLKFREGDAKSVCFQLAFFTRMVFSCLVDADFLATEEFMNPSQGALRRRDDVPFERLQSELNRFLQGVMDKATPGVVAKCRRKVLEDCRQAALQPPGLFSLTVPTGGGKTLSSLAFALDHAIAHDRRRIIYAIPFTSIVEQTAQVFRNVFKDLPLGLILEHHSNLDPEQEDIHSRLATENWDAPLIVTTNVQLLESLFACRTSRCRKLHNIVNSVIILDEAQALPVDRLAPCLAALEELTRNYGCTVVLCTATQPALMHAEKFPIGLSNVREIIRDPQQLDGAMRRVRVESLGRLNDDDLLARLASHESCLTIVNTRGHAARLYQALVQRHGSNADIFHLSTLMCGQHRSDTLTEIRRRLKEKRPCQVVSTQLIEAGVDVDFPVVYRALSGLDSIAQAAGRCNREGRLSSATVFVFEPTDIRLQGELAVKASTALELIPKYDDLLSPAAVNKYFHLHRWKNQGENNWDKTTEKGVMNCFLVGKTLAFNFRDAAERFQLIENEGESIFVPYNAAGAALLEELRAAGPNRELMRRLQRYTVTLYESLYQCIQPSLELYRAPNGRSEFAILSMPGSYDSKLGVRLDRDGVLPPDCCHF